MPSRRSNTKVNDAPRLRKGPTVKSHKEKATDGRDMPHGDFGKQALPKHVKRANRATKRKTSAWRPLRKSDPTMFGRIYDRGDLPLAVLHGAKRKVVFKVRIQDLNISEYLPMFFEGLREMREPHAFIAEAGLLQMLEHGGHMILPVIPDIILPIKQALDTKNRDTIRKTLQAIRVLVSCHQLVGPALVPYFRQLLPVFNLVLLLENRGRQEFDGCGRKKTNLVDEMNDTLEVLLKYGGRGAYINIKYMIPVYEICDNTN